jgi:hypothetical protein
VRQVDYLPELYKDGQSEKYEILIQMFMRNLWLRLPALIQFFRLLFEGKLPLSVAPEFENVCQITSYYSPILLGLSMFPET